MIIVGLGNPGDEYINTRHNAGRIVLDIIAKKIDAGDFECKKLLKALVTSGKIDSEKVTLVKPETFMNNSGFSLKTLIKDPTEAPSIVVVYDDLDLPIGSMKISFNRGTGGHKGVDSIVNHIKTGEFLRFRIGISPKNEEGETQKVCGADQVEKYVLGNFRENEIVEIEKIGEKVFEALKLLIKEGKERTMTEFN